MDYFKVYMSQLSLRPRKYTQEPTGPKSLRWSWNLNVFIRNRNWKSALLQSESWRCLSSYICSCFVNDLV